MAEAAYNLVTITGNRNELDILEKTAYKNVSEAFNLGNFISCETNSTTPYHAVFGTNWVAFGVLIEKTENSLKYYFNSKWNAVNLGYIVNRFTDLTFKQVYVDIASEKVGIIYYNSDQKLILNDFNFWENSCSPYTYNFIEELALKLDYLLSQAITNISSEHFFEEIDRNQFINKHGQQYEEILINTVTLEKQDLYYARYGMFYTLHSHKKEELEQFIRSNIQCEKKDYFLDKLDKVNFKISKERCWWNCLSQEWKQHLDDCLLFSNPQKYRENFKQDFKSTQVSDNYLKAILTLNSIILPFPLIFDDLETVLDLLTNLKYIYLDFEGYSGDIVLDSESINDIIEHLPNDIFQKHHNVSIIH